MYTKSLILDGVITKDKLHKANNEECAKLNKIFHSDDFHVAVDNFLKQQMLKNKL